MRVCLLALCLALQLPAGEWLKLKSPNFELYSNAGEKRARAALNYFEQVRGLFVKMFPSFLQEPLPVRIVSFSSEKDFKPYRPTDAATAYYLPDEDRDYVVMSNLGPDAFPVAAHEYMHLLIRHSKLKLPLWLEEGFADVNSMIDPHPDKVLVGMYSPGRMAELRSSKWMRIDELMGVVHDSPEYNERQRAGLFYAESWLLTHMLYLGDEYRPKFGTFLARVVQGEPAASAVQDVYGKTQAELGKDLRSYLANGRINVIPLDATLDGSAASKAVADAIPELDLRLTLALLLSRTDRAGAQDAYQALERDFPNSWEVQEAIAHQAMYHRNLEEARVHFRNAIRLGPPSATRYFSYAKLLQGDSTESREFADALSHAVQLNPNLTDARYLLGLTYYNLQDYPHAVEQLSKIKKIGPDQAAPLFLSLAYSYERLHQLAPARDSAAQARKFAQTESDRDAADRLLEYLDAVDRRAK